MKTTQDNSFTTFIKSPIFTVLFLGALAAFVLTVSASLFSDLSLRLDEAQSLWQASRSPLELLSIIAKDVHVPLYHLMLHIWQSFLGNDASTARLLSLFFFLLNIPAFYALGKLAYGRNVALFATLLFTISPFMIWYGNEIRMYSLFSLIITLNYYFFLRIYKGDNDWTWIGYGATALVGIYTHYFFFLALATQAMFFFMYRSLFPRYAFRRFVTIAIFLAIAFLPWLLYVYAEGSASNTRPTLTPPGTINVFNTFSQFLFGFQEEHLNALLISLWPLAALVGFLALRKNQRVSPTGVFFVAAFAVPMILAFIISSVYRPLFLSRYLILTLPPLVLFLSWILSTYPRRLSLPIKTGFAILVLAMLGVQAINTQAPVKEDYRAAMEYINEASTPRDIIVVSAPFTVYPAEYYHNGLTPIETIPRWDRLQIGPIPPFSAEALPEDIEAINGSHERIWLLLSYDQGYEDDIRSYFDNNYERISEQAISPGLTLSLYRLRYDL